MLEREVKRYAAYFRGWCQAFGEHDSFADHEKEIYWLLSKDQAGFVLPRVYLRRLYRAVLLHETAPPLTFRSDQVQVGDFSFSLTPNREALIRETIDRLLSSGGGLHVYLTSHFMYGTNARIITLSAKKPLSIIYKNIGNMKIRLE
ncbi:MAG: hypothetical protein V2I48_12440 [Xanthomonadales bacterium]|jgi:hypothetical protein|nr:hypothetical protein [Xanthomonadales bacterium]